MVMKNKLCRSICNNHLISTELWPWSLSTGNAWICRAGYCTVIFHTLTTIFLALLNQKFQHLSKHKLPASPASVSTPVLFLLLLRKCTWSPSDANPTTVLLASSCHLRDVITPAMTLPFSFLCQAFLFLLHHSHQKRYKSKNKTKTLNLQCLLC